MISKEPLAVTMNRLGDIVIKMAKSMEGFSKLMQETQGGNLRKQISDKWTLEGKTEDTS